MTKTSPDDARCVVWALGEYFFFSLYFLATKKNFIALIYKICDRGVTEADGDQNGLKRCIWHRVGPRSVFFLTLHIFSVLTNIL